LTSWRVWTLEVCLCVSTNWQPRSTSGVVVSSNCFFFLKKWTNCFSAQSLTHWTESLLLGPSKSPGRVGIGLRRRGHTTPKSPCYSSRLKRAAERRFRPGVDLAGSSSRSATVPVPEVERSREIDGRCTYTFLL